MSKNEVLSSVDLMGIKFSIVMPCYNSENYIDRAINSCINQTYKNWELIVINDGSTDNTLQIVNSYTSKDNRILVFSKENGGYVSAVNYGLDHIRGSYFLLLGSDDELKPSLFTDIYDYIKDSKEYPDMIGFKTEIYKDNDKIIKDEYTDFNYIAQAFSSNIKDFIDHFPKHAIVFVNRDTSKLYKTEVLGSLRYFGKKGVDADGIFSMCFAHKSSSFLSVPVMGYIWHWREGSVSGKKFDYQTQLDRLNNWIQYGAYIKKMDSKLISKQEINSLTNTFYRVLRDVYFEYNAECKKDRVIEIAKEHINGIIKFCNYRVKSKELKVFLNHTATWKLCIVHIIYYERLKEYKETRRIEKTSNLYL